MEESDSKLYTIVSLTIRIRSKILAGRNGNIKSIIRYIYQCTDLSYRWFSVTMGTGIVSILLHNLPYNGRWLYWLSVIVFCLNILLFCTFLLISILRYAIYPEIWRVMIRHPAQSLFLGTFPMGLATIVNMVALVCVPAWGDWAAYLVSLV